MRPIIVGILGLLAMLPAMASTKTPNIRVCVQLIEMPHTAMTELLSGKAKSGDALHDGAIAMTREGKAKILESAMVTTRSGINTKLDSYGELIFPTEYEPPQLPCTPPAPRIRPTSPQPRPAFSTPTCFETRNTGLSLEVSPSLNPFTTLINFHGMLKIVDLSSVSNIKEYRDQWGDASIEMPNFETSRINNMILDLRLGKFELASTITPKPTEAVPATMRKILVFVRCDVVPVASSR